MRSSRRRGGDFHVYDIEWRPSGVRYFADAKLLRTWTAKIDLLRLPANILLTIWTSNAADWAGAPTSTSAPHERADRLDPRL